MREKVRMSRILVVFYSRTGTTETAAHAIAAALGADAERIRDTRSRAGLLGYFRSAFEAARGRDGEIAPMDRDPATYDLVVVGSPVWSGSLSSPVRTYLQQHRGRLRAVAFFCTEGARGAQPAFRQMAQVSDRAPIGVLELTGHQVRIGTHIGPLERFVERIRLAVPTAVGA
jgi:flavodoxin